MAKVTALTYFTDRDGVVRTPNEQFDLPRETDLDKYEFDLLIQHGTVTRSNSAPTETVNGR